MNGAVSIVIIGRNEERGVEKCVRAAQTAAQIGGAEIIYVDSASTDDTVRIVESLGIRVVALDPNQKLCPSAGRFAGSRAANGEFILFLDADTLIYEDFLPAAVEHFRCHPPVAGINGRIDDTDESGVLFADVGDRFDEIAEIEWLRGPACFYRRAALIAAGSFNPQLLVEEEAELGLRLLKNGWRLNLLPVPMACHTRCYHNQTFASLLNSLRRDLATGRIGEVISTMLCAFRQGFGWKFCRLRLKTTLFFVVWLMSCAACVFLPLFLYPSVIFTLVVVLGAIAVWYKKRDLY